MLLAIDIGNTNITLGLHDGIDWRRQWRLRTVHDKTQDEYGVYLKSLLSGEQIDSDLETVILSSVVPPLTSTFKGVCRSYLDINPFVVDSSANTGVRILTDNPSEVGADRIVNAAAAHALYRSPAVVVDMGTATTFDVVSASGDLVGVSIAPGLGTAAAALTSRAAQLGHVALEAPPSAIGTNTVHAMQSGLVFGYTALVEGMVNRIVKEWGEEDVLVIGTGGLISIIQEQTNLFDHIEPWLTLDGLKAIGDLNLTTDVSRNQ
ncbi:MAG: type III pantothenate kinase [Candidatus Promineifilaceae bacterium]|jgi:type III pantothenate kinase